jgi:asparagine synthase (glutamine-hydrolysing)
MWGVKPLFWRRMQSGVVFASEQRPLVENLPPLPLNRHAVAEFLAFGRVLGDGSFLEGLYSVPPGGSAIIHNGLMEVRPGRGRASRSHNAQAGVPPGPAELRRAIAESVARTLVSERIVGLAISGGLDSTIIAAELNRLGCEDLATVSVTALDSNDGVREIAQLGLPNGSWTTWHHEHRHFTPEMLPRGIERAVRLLGEPTRMSSVPLYIELAEACTHLGIIVLLSGEGADELFGGYTSYSAWRTVAEAKGTVLDKLEAFALPAKRMSYLAALLGTQSVMLTRTAFRETYADLGRLDAFDALRLLELELSLQPLLTRVDHALMERGVEGRVPFLHGNVPALALALPAEQLCDHTRTKIALRSAYRGILPDRFVDEAKRPFRAPIAAWLAGPLKAWVRARFGIGGNLLEAVGIARTGVEVVVGAAFAGDGEAVSLTFSLLSILAWLEWMIEIEGLDAPDLRRAAACRQGMH